METTSHAGQKLLSLLFRPAELVEFRCFAPRGVEKPEKPVQRWREARIAESLFGELAVINRTHEVYFGVNPRRRMQGAKAEDVLHANCIVVDLDDYDPRKLAGFICSEGLPKATAIVASGHGAHAYWKLSAPLTDLSRWSRIQCAAANALGGDNIKDAPRVMRLPGFINIGDKTKGETPVPVELLEVDDAAVYDVDDLWVAFGADRTQIAPDAPPIVQPLAGNESPRLLRSTLEFLSFGAPNGERNNRLFSAACDMAGNGLAKDRVASLLEGPSLRSGLTADEIGASIASAFNAPRSPGVDSENRVREFEAALGGESSSSAGDTVEATRPAGHRAKVANIIDANYLDDDGKEKRIAYYVPVDRIGRALSEASGGWPRRCGELLFVAPDTFADSGIHDRSSVQWLGNVDDLFAWIHSRADLRWSCGECRHHIERHLLTPVTKREFMAFAQQQLNETYRAVEVLPHEPPIPDVYYLPTLLPDSVDSDEYTPLFELIDRMNAETELDRMLLFAAMLTPGWGGPAGRRPAFLFTSDHGRGVGKTTTAEIICKIWGGHFEVSATEDWDQVRKRILSDDSLTKRTCIIDNIRGSYSGSDIESLVTASMISGWKPYVGQASRPNYMTWFLTANTPTVSEDLADRSVVIKIGRQKHELEFKGWAENHIEKHRASIIADLLRMLKRPAAAQIAKCNRDRWNEWQSGVLSRIPDADKLAALIKSRRPDVSQDRIDAGDVFAVVVGFVSPTFPDWRDRRIFITRNTMVREFKKSEMFADFARNTRGLNQWLRGLCGTGQMTALSETTWHGNRGWILCGPNALPESLIDAMPEIGGTP